MSTGRHPATIAKREKIIMCVTLSIFNLVGQKFSLIAVFYIRLKDRATGKIRVILGEKANIVPEPTEDIYRACR